MRKLQVRRSLRLFVIPVAVAAMSVVTFSAPAQAHSTEGLYGTSFVDGAGSLSDDFGEHYSELGHYLCWGCAHSWNTDLVVLWQLILFSEDLLGPTEIDGRFGSRTDSATRAWQRRYGLTDDGVVGPATWRRADSQLRWTWDDRFNAWWVDYVGKTHVGFVSFTRGKIGEHGSGGAYEIRGAVQGRDGAEAYPLESDGHRMIHFYKRTIGILA